ncbi:MAG: diguanylate cyclase [Rhodocyclaceae bacterium]|nr:diguanylate cyclase [Rhodocyclaceae bacterium]MBK6553942.1 diguanylate cyclase [Rhodocyclaceae bacterium]MBK9310780.1 diguanylate cyclase [Rhodocyclaceae bacterium]
MTTPIDLEKFEQLKATGVLPSPKGAAMAIIRLTRRDDVPLSDLAHAVKGDPAFVGRLIKAANSVQAGTRRPVASVNDALVVLGIPTVRALALGFSLLSENRSGRCKNFDYSRFWSLSLARAIALQALVMRTRLAAPEECFSVGLLSHIGELSLATLFPEEYSHLLADAKAESVEGRFARERESFAMTHAELSAAMLMDWGLPKAFIEPVHNHEQVEKAGIVEGSRPYGITWALALAHRIAEMCLAPELERRSMMPAVLRIGSYLSIEVDALTALCNKAAQEWLEWGALLGIDTEALVPFEELSVVPGIQPMFGERSDSPGTHEPMRILIVDDDVTFRAMLKVLLTNYGHEVYEAVDGQQAFEMAVDLRPQVMVVDWMMPSMDGIELTLALRQTKVGRRIYIMLLTGLDDDQHLIRAFDAGVDDYLTKPLRPKVLSARLSAGFRVVRLQDEIERDREEIRRFAAELAVSNRRLQEAALTDPLTGFPNRRYVMERLEQEWAASLRSKRPLACMVVDLDAFKPINDRYGHDIGDIVLKQAAQALKRGLRTPDVVARLGGDEFLVICPDTTLTAALACAERVRHSVESMVIPTGDLRLDSTVSIGVAVRDEGMETSDALVKCADQGLYLAKEKGRNRVAAFQQVK